MAAPPTTGQTGTRETLLFPLFPIEVRLDIWGWAAKSASREINLLPEPYSGENGPPPHIDYLNDYHRSKGVGN